MLNVSDILTPSYPDLPLARELDDALVPVPLLLVADGADPGHSIVMRHVPRVTSVTRVTRHLMTTLMLSPSMSELSPVPSDLTDPLADLAREPALPGLQINQNVNATTYEYTEIFTIKCENTVGLWIRSKQMAHISTL